VMVQHLPDRRHIACLAKEGGFSSLKPYNGKPKLGVSFVPDSDTLRAEVIRIVNAAPMGFVSLPIGHQALVFVYDLDLAGYIEPFAIGRPVVHVGCLEVLSELRLWRIVEGCERYVLLEEAGLLFEPGTPRQCSLCAKAFPRRAPYYSITDEYGEACYCVPCRERMVALALNTADRTWSFHRFGK